MTNRKAVFLIVFTILLAFGLKKQIHFLDYPIHYRSALFSDKAGYYVYLPALFIYNLDASNPPEGFPEKMGGGFDIEDDKFVTKYYYGLALFEAPFFAAAHLYAHLSAYTADGFSRPYYIAMTVANVFYGTLGLYFLSLFLSLLRGFSRRAKVLTMLSLLFCTNLL